MAYAGCFTAPRETRQAGAREEADAKDLDDRARDMPRGGTPGVFAGSRGCTPSVPAASENAQVPASVIKRARKAGRASVRVALGRAPCRQWADLVEVPAPCASSGLLNRRGRRGGAHRLRGFGGGARRRVARDHLGHHLLADLDALLDQPEIDRGRRALARQLLDAFLRLVAHVAGRYPQDSLRRVFRPVERGNERVVLVVAGDEPGLRIRLR